MIPLDRLLQVGEPQRATRALALRLLQVGLDAVDARAATERVLARHGPLGPVHLLAFGKAALPMTRAALARCDVQSGIVIAPTAPSLPAQLTSYVGGHPLPASDAIAHGAHVMQFAERLPKGANVLVLISGGGSAMLELPKHGITRDDLAAVTGALLAAGADIVALNTVRAAFSRVKGGGLARALGHTRLTNVILSDVVEGPRACVASGPTLPPMGGDARAVLARFGVEGRLTAAMHAALAEVAPAFEDRAATYLAADNLSAQRAMLAFAQTRGLSVRLELAPVRGEARSAGRRFLARALEHPDCITLGGGETTVTVHGAGAGGRNQEFVLGGLTQPPFDGTLASLATDGVDGTSDAAGALGDDATRARANALGLDVRDALARNDAAPFFAKVDAAIVTGPTTTNVADVCLYVPASCAHPPAR